MKSKNPDRQGSPKEQPEPPNHSEETPRDDPRERGMEESYTGPENQRGITAHGLEQKDDLRKAKEFAEMVVDTVREGLLVLDLDLRVQAANASFYRMFDVSREETEGHLLYELGNRQWDIPALREMLETILPEDKAFNDFRVEHTFEGIGPRVLLLNARQLDDHQMILLAIEDVTEEQASKQELRESEARYRFFIENAQEYAIFLMDAKGHIMSWNRGAERVFGYTADEAIGQPVAIIFTEEERAIGAPEHEQATAAETGRAADNRWHVRKDGTLFWANGVIESLRDEDGILRGFIKILRDNTERKQAEEALRALNEELEQRVEQRTQKVRDLASTLTRAEQEERRRISQILHDDLQQLLYGIQMKISAVRRDMQAGEHERLPAYLADADEWIIDAISTTRQLTVDLSPPVLKSKGLTDTLAWLQAQMRELHNLQVTVNAAHAYSIPDEAMRVLLFQIVRELLFNVVKHARTNHATVEIDDSDGHLIIRVLDDGQGFDVEEAASRAEHQEGFGLFSVRERLQLFGGSMEVVSAPGTGTRITIHTPVEPQRPDPTEA